MRPYSSALNSGSNYTYFMCLGIGASQGKNPNKGHGYKEIHPKC